MFVLSTVVPASSTTSPRAFVFTDWSSRFSTVTMLLPSPPEAPAGALVPTVRATVVKRAMRNRRMVRACPPRDGHKPDFERSLGAITVDHLPLTVAVNDRHVVVAVH